MLDKYEYAFDMNEDDLDIHAMNLIMRSLGEVQPINTKLGIIDPLNKSSFVSHERHSKLTAEALAENWCIGLMKAKSTLLATTQHF